VASFGEWWDEVRGWKEWSAGAELSVYGFLGSLIQAYGVMNTTATKAGLLLSLKIVFVPLIVAAMGEKLGLGMQE
jgi:drug/metabolite transporter (DMT)-like permease